MLGKHIGYDVAWSSVGASLPNQLLGTLVGWLVLQAVTGQHEITRGTTWSKKVVTRDKMVAEAV